MLEGEVCHSRRRVAVFPVDSAALTHRSVAPLQGSLSPAACVWGPGVHFLTTLGLPRWFRLGMAYFPEGLRNG